MKRLLVVVLALLLTACGTIDWGSATPQDAIASARHVNSADVRLMATASTGMGLVTIWSASGSGLTADLLVKKGQRWASAGGSVAPLTDVHGLITITGGGLSGEKGAVGWAYGQVLDPSVRRIMLETDPGVDLEAAIQNGTFLVTQEDSAVLKFRHVRVLGESDRLLGEASYSWP